MEYIAALTLGLAGGLHCAGMCGPIAMAVGRSVSYLVGRILMYALLGAVVGAGASVISLSSYGRTLSITAGAIMIVLALLQVLWNWNPLPQQSVMRILQPVRTALQLMLKKRSTLGLLGIGALNGLLPCGLVTSALFGAISTTTMVGGALFMLVFGIGTLPVMATMTFGGTWIRARIGSRYRMVLPIVALIVGSAVVVRGMGLGIPYLSPKPPSIIQETGCCGGHPSVHHLLQVP